jgi:hypothetical protein
MRKRGPRTDQGGGTLKPIALDLNGYRYPHNGLCLDSARSLGLAAERLEHHRPDHLGTQPVNQACNGLERPTPQTDGDFWTEAGCLRKPAII